MSPLKELYRRYIAALAIADDGLRDRELDVLLASNFIAHDLVEPLPPGGAGALKAFRRLVMAAFPDQAMVIEDLIAEGDRVASRQTITGTHLGPYMGIEPTGIKISIQLLEIVQIHDGHTAQRWVAFDRGGLLTTLSSGGRR